MKVGETHPTGGEAIDVWRFHFRIAITAERSTAQVIRHDEDDVWFTLRDCHQRERSQRERDPKRWTTDPPDR